MIYLILYKLGEKHGKQRYFNHFYLFEYSTAYCAKILVTPTVMESIMWRHHLLSVTEIG